MDDLARALARDDVAGEMLTEPERAAEIYVEHFAPVLLGKIEERGAADDTGVVDENIGATQRAHGFRDDRRRRFRRADVGSDSHAAPAEGRDALLQWRGVAASDERHISSSLGESQHHSGAETARGTRDNGHFAIESKTVDYGGHGDGQRMSAGSTGSMSAKTWFSPPMPQTNP